MADLILEPWPAHTSDAVKHEQNAMWGGLTKPDMTAPPRNWSALYQQAPEPITQAISDRADSLVVERLLLKKGIAMTTPNLDGLQGAFASFTQRVEAAAQGLTKRMDDVAALTETAVTKFGAAVDKVEAQAKTIDDAANQLTNGGPPLGN